MSKQTEIMKAADGFKFDAKATGPKPNAQQFTDALKLGCKPGNKVWAAMAMYLRPQGATNSEVCAVNGIDNPQRVKMAQRVEQGYARRVPMAKRNGQTVYKIELVKPYEGGAAKAKAKADTATKAKPATKAKGGSAKRKRASKAKAANKAAAQ